MTERWQSAQVAERRYHMELMDPALERSLHRGIAGLLRLTRDEVAPCTVLDVASGPLSLLHDYPARVGTALDPLHFGDFEQAYERAGIVRVHETAEAFTPIQRQWDEVWMYNCLQHVAQPGVVLGKLTTWARARIRLFEWVEQPTSVVHLHTLQRAEIAAVLWSKGWQPALNELRRGTWGEQGVADQQFYAAQWVPFVPKNS